MLKGLVIAPLSMSLLSIYSLARLNQSSELELITINLCFILLILFPRIRSKLLRRRTFVNAWMKEGHWLQELLQGGALYMVLQLIISLPVAFVLLIELQHIRLNSWYFLIPLSLVAASTQLIINQQLSGVLKSFAASVLAREWSTYIFMGGSALILGYQALYTVRPDLSDRSLQDAMQFINETTPNLSSGFLGDLMFLSSLKETAFWWTIIKTPELLSSLPSTIVGLCQAGLAGIYTLYQISIVYALGQLFAGILELSDSTFYAFIEGRQSKTPSATQTPSITESESQ